PPERPSDPQSATTNRTASENHGKFALMHDGELEMVLHTVSDALEVGMRLFGRGKFSIVEIAAQPARLGAVAFSFA
ncbi:MAG: hypothetical protein OXH42_11020, partial [Acidimicrobiaceae bacterium]|nr:hypothetical protein [Acidimicrobiaceae bacterium]